MKLRIKPGRAVRTIKVLMDEKPTPPRPVDKQARLVNEPDQKLKNALALPGHIAGWVMLSDGVRLIVALPDQNQLVYIDTVANKELKRVKLPFKPYLLAVQQKRLFVSARTEQTRNDVHVLDVDTAEEKKTLALPGSWLTDMVCSREKGLVYAFESDGTPIAFDPGVGSASRVVILAEPVVMAGVFDDRRYSIPQTHRFIAQSLVMDPKNANVLYGAVNAYGSLGTARAPFLIMKLTVKGKELVGIGAPNARRLPGSRQRRRPESGRHCRRQVPRRRHRHYADRR